MSVKVLRLYRTSQGNSPVEDWIDNLSDVVGTAKIDVRIRRAMLGNLGDHRSVGGGVIELRVDWGPGYRIYLGLQGQHIIVLLCGGDKSSQQKDIRKAYIYWDDYKKRYETL